MKIPRRPAPPVPRIEPVRTPLHNSNNPKRAIAQVQPKKKAPPRPPPPKLNNDKLSKNDTFDTTSLIDFNNPPEQNCDKIPLPSGSHLHKTDFSTSLIDLSIPAKETILKQNLQVGNSSFFGNSLNSLDLPSGAPDSTNQIKKPTIIRAQQPKVKKDNVGVQASDPYVRGYFVTGDYSPPMPTFPPPSPPMLSGNPRKVVLKTPHGIALYDYHSSQPDDLALQANDLVILVRRVNSEWYYGKVGEREGIFPANYIDVRVPLSDDQEKIVTALYEFKPETRDDLGLTPGQHIKVLKLISDGWLYGESNGQTGQFPANFVDHIPFSL